MEIKLLATDLDGTLLTHERRPHPRAAEAIRRAEQTGVIVAIATGRIRQSAQMISSLMDFHGPLVVCNGAHVLSHEGTELRFLSVSQAVKAIVFDYAKAEGLQLCAYGRDGVMFLQKSKWGEVYRQRINVDVREHVSREEVMAEELLKVMIIDEPSAILGHRNRLSRELAGESVTITESEPEYLEFLPESADKGSGVACLAAHYGVAQHQVAALGDYLNDLEMLKFAGLSGAVENAVNEAKAVADVVVASNDAGGFAEFVDDYVLKPIR